MSGLGKLGLSIPRDISLVSYEVDYMNSFMPLKITGVTQRFYEMGKAAASIIIGLLNNTHESDMTGFICHSLLHSGGSILKRG